MTPSTKRLLLAAVAVVALLVIGATVALLVGRFWPSSSGTAASGTSSSFGSSLPASTASGPSSTPQPRILVIDRASILRQSAAGKDMIAQVDVLSKSAEAEFKGEEDRLRSDAQALQQQMAVLAPEVRNQKAKEFDVRQQALQKKVQERQNQIQAGVFKSRKQIEDTLGPILEALMAERGANLLFDRNAVVLGTVDVDVTNVAIQRLDQKLTKVKVELTSPDSLNAGQPAQPQTPVQQ
jgi:Skp family chaperone for outer membrane proteins